MTHLSDYSYGERLIQSLFINLWLLYELYSADKFSSLSPLRNKSKSRFRCIPPLKSIVTWLLLTSYLLFIIYDVIATEFKYKEGFFIDPKHGILQKPASKYSKNSATKVQICGQLINFAFTFQTSGLFLLLAYMNEFVSKTLNLRQMSNNPSNNQANTALFSTNEYRLVMIYSWTSIFIYCFLSYVLTDPLLSVVLPQCLNHIENFVIVFLTQITNKRIKKLVKRQEKYIPLAVPFTNINNNDKGQNTINITGNAAAQTNSYSYQSNQMSAAKDVTESLTRLLKQNNFMCLALLSQGIGLGTINVDILNFKFWGGKPTIYYSKVATDILTIFFSFGWSTAIISPMLILIRAASGAKLAMKKTFANPSTILAVNE